MTTTTQKTMRRMTLLFAAMVLALVVSSGVALAVTKSCEAEVDGLGGNNLLYGQGGPDKLFGGPNRDNLVGGPGNDALSGGEDIDIYWFEGGWGKDIITDDATSQNMVVIKDSVTADLIIRLFSGEGPEVKNASATSTIEWEESAVKSVRGGSGDDQITGSFLDNTIYGGTGADTISASLGDDEVHVSDGKGDDVVNCGEALPGGGNSDNDVVFFDSGDTIDPNCEIQHP
jgi:Ca2+-binding RTX toxin-like protein